MFKKFVITVGVFLFIIIAGFFVWRYVKYIHDENPDKTFLLPKIEFAQTEIVSLTSEKTEMISTILIKNQVPLTFSADSLHYKVFINNVKIVTDTYKKSIVLKGNDSSIISLPVTVLHDNLISVLKTNEKKKKDSVEFRLEGSFYADLGFRKKVDINIEKKLPVIHMPKVLVEQIKVDSLNFSRAIVILVVKVKNENAFPIKVKNVSYDFGVEDNEWIRGMIPGLTGIDEQSVSEVYVPVRISLKETRKTLFDILKRGDMVNYKFNLAFNVESENKMIKNSKVVLKSSGTVKSLIELSKK